MENSIANLIVQSNEGDTETGNRLKDFEILQVLGQGAYGFVAKVKSKLNLKIYALKKYDSKYLKNPQSKKYVLNESVFMKELKHENVVRLYNDFYENEDLYLIMEYMDGGDLYTFINAHMNFNIKIEEEKLWNIFEQSLKGLVYLHKKGLIHRDIKPANLLMNNKGDIKYSDFNVSAIINTDKARDFTKDKNKEENLLNNMTVVGSGKYAAPEIDDQSAIYIEYDLKVDVYSLGITFCTLTFFDMELPDQQTINSYGYSKELVNVIEAMTKKEVVRRPSSQEAYNLLIKYYVEKYVNSTGIISCVQSLFSSPSIYNYFFNYHIPSDKIDQMPITGKVLEIFREIYTPQQNNNNMINYNSMNVKSSGNLEKKSFNHLIYDLRNLLVEKGMDVKKRENNEISPIYVITFLLKKLHEELNIFRGKLGNLNVIFSKIVGKGNPKLEAYESYMKFYTNNFQSIISTDYYGLIKTKTICKKCEEENDIGPDSTKYSFKVLCYIPINVKILFEMNPNKSFLNLHDAFDSLNHTFVDLDKNQFIQCAKCEIVTEHKELKQFYNLSKNLVIIFDRGENHNFTNYVDFPEILELNGNYVENFEKINVNYVLKSIICRTKYQQENNKRIQEKFESFIPKGNGLYMKQSNSQNQNEIYSLEQIKKNFLVLSLFYYSDNGVPNFSDDVDNINNSNLNQNNNMISNMNNNNIMNNFNNNGNMNNNGNGNFNGNIIRFNSNDINNNFNNMNGNFNNNMNNNFNMNGNNMNNNINQNFNGMNNNQNMINGNNNNNFQNDNRFQNFQMNPNFNQQQNNNNNQNFINNNQNNWNQNNQNFMQMNNNMNNSNNVNNNMNNNINNNMNRNFNQNNGMNGNMGNNFNNPINMNNIGNNNRINLPQNNYNNNMNNLINNNLNNGNNNQMFNNGQQMMRPQKSPNNQNNYNNGQQIMMQQNSPNNQNNYNNRPDNGINFPSLQTPKSSHGNNQFN